MSAEKGDRHRASALLKRCCVSCGTEPVPYFSSRSYFHRRHEHENRTSHISISVVVTGRGSRRTRTSCGRRDYQFGFAKSLDRKNVTVRASFDEGRTWPVLRTLEPGISGYSDLAVGPDGTIYCFYERGGVDDVMWDTKCLCVARFSLHWLTDRNPR